MRLGWVETPLPLAESRRPGLAWAAPAASGVVEFAAAGTPGAGLIVVTVEPPPTATVAAETAEPPIEAGPGVLDWSVPPMDTEPAPVVGLPARPEAFDCPDRSDPLFVS
jgi:hypothetical protein